MPNVLLDAAGRRRSPATMPGFHPGRPPRNKDRRYPADPPTVEEIVAVMQSRSSGPTGQERMTTVENAVPSGVARGSALAKASTSWPHPPTTALCALS